MIQQRDVEFYKEHGYLLVRGVFNEAESNKMRSAVDDLLIRAAEAKYERNAAWDGDFIPADQLKKLVIKGMLDVHYHDASGGDSSEYGDRPITADRA